MEGKSLGFWKTLYIKLFTKYRVKNTGKSYNDLHSLMGSSNRLYQKSSDNETIRLNVDSFKRGPKIGLRYFEGNVIESKD